MGFPPLGSLRSDEKKCDDPRGLRHPAVGNGNFQTGRCFQPAPMLFTPDRHSLFLGNVFRGRSAFLVCGGPSLIDNDLTLLDQRGLLTCAVNNAATVYRSHLWVSVDNPGNFCDAIWRDPAIWKFVPQDHMDKRFTIRGSQGQLVPSEEKVGELPSVFGFRRNEQFVAQQWLYEDTFNWGNSSKRVDAYGNKGSRSVMYVALKLMFYLGVRRLFLLGCDFRMSYGAQNYAFPQERSRGSVRGNNSSYRILNVRLQKLKPYFDFEGFEIYNCTPQSGLTVFPYMPFKQAVDEARKEMPAKIVTDGMYDRRHRQGRPDVAASVSLQSAAPPLTSQMDSAAASPANLDLTTVVPLDKTALQLFVHTWPTWVANRPGLSDRPMMLLLDEELEPQLDELCCMLGSARAQIRFVRRTLNASWTSDIIRAISEHVETHWYLLLDPRAVALTPMTWAAATWFAGDESGQAPVVVGPAWSYTRPADTFEWLDRWADDVDGLRQHPPLRLTYDPSANRLQHPTISGWCLFGRVDWMKNLAAWTLGGAPRLSDGREVALETLINYCALRRKERLLRVPMKDYGWEHHFGDTRWIAEKCRQSLPAAMTAERQLTPV